MRDAKRNATRLTRDMNKLQTGVAHFKASPPLRWSRESLLIEPFWPGHYLFMNIYLAEVIT